MGEEKRGEERQKRRSLSGPVTAQRHDGWVGTGHSRQREEERRRGGGGKRREDVDR